MLLHLTTCSLDHNRLVAKFSIQRRLTRDVLNDSFSLSIIPLRLWDVDSVHSMTLILLVGTVLYCNFHTLKYMHSIRFQIRLRS